MDESLESIAGAVITIGFYPLIYCAARVGIHTYAFVSALKNHHNGAVRDNYHKIIGRIDGKPSS